MYDLKPHGLKGHDSDRGAEVYFNLHDVFRTRIGEKAYMEVTKNINHINVEIFP